MIDGLERLSSVFEDLAGFLYVIKATLDSLVVIIGDVYGFSDEYFRALAEQVCDDLKKNNVGSSQPEQIDQLNKQFAMFYLQSVTSTLLHDHRNIFYFYLGNRGHPLSSSHHHRLAGLNYLKSTC